MTFKEWFNSAPHRAKYSNDHPAYLAAQEAWEAAHEECAKVCEAEAEKQYDNMDIPLTIAADLIRAREEIK